MLVKIEEVIPCEFEELCDEVTIVFSVRGNKYHAFSGLDDFSPGEVVDVCFTCIDGGCGTWEERFNRNTSHTKSLVYTGKWSYDGFGQIVALGPVVGDFGDIRLELGDFTHDTRCIGENIYERIDRLDILRKDHRGSG